MEFKTFQEHRWNEDCPNDNFEAFQKCKKEFENDALTHTKLTINGPLDHIDFKGHVFKRCVFLGDITNCNFSGAFLNRCNISGANFNFVDPEQIKTNNIDILNETTLVPFCSMVEVSMYSTDKAVTFMPVEIRLEKCIKVPFLMRMYDWKDPKTEKIKNKIGLIALKDITFSSPPKKKNRLFRGGIYYIPRPKENPIPKIRKDLGNICRKKKKKLEKNNNPVKIVPSSQYEIDSNLTLRFARMLNLEDLEDKNLDPTIQELLFPVTKEVKQQKREIQNAIFL